MKWTDVADLQWKDLKKLRKLDRDDVLHRIGLEEHTPTSDFFTSLGLFAVGVVVGAGVGMMFAPKPGAELRETVGGAIRRRSRQAQEFGEQLGGDASAPPVGNTIR